MFDGQTAWSDRATSRRCKSCAMSSRCVVVSMTRSRCFGVGSKARRAIEIKDCWTSRAHEFTVRSRHGFKIATTFFDVFYPSLLSGT
jgi:hypothetical protein